MLLRRNMRWRLRNRKDTGSLIAMAVFAGLLMGARAPGACRRVHPSVWGVFGM